jgi:hypothetical protein
MVIVCTAVNFSSPFTKYTRPLLTSCVLVLKFLKVILILCEQFNELSSSLRVDIVMAPVASSAASKLHLWVKLDDSFTTVGKIVICVACNESFGCSMKSQLEQQVRSALYAKNKQLSSSKKQVLLTHMQHMHLKKRIFQGYVQLDGVREHPLV